MLQEHLHNLWLRLKAVVKRRQLDRDLAEELEFHLAMREQKLIEQGMSPREARYTARRGFGNAVSLKETSRDMWSFPSLESIVQDIRYGLRQLRSSPGFTALAIITLVLGIGATTAIFSVVYGVVLDPRPYADSDRLAVLVTHDPNEPQGDPWAWVSGPEFLDYQQQNHVFDELLGGAGAGVLLTGNGVPEWFDGRAVTSNLFRVLGVAPLIGRPITAEDAKPGAVPVVVLSYKVWQSKFGGDTGTVGRTLIMNHQLTTVVGVMPQRFGWCWDLCVPANLSRARRPDPLQTFAVEGHLKPGVTMEQAAAEMEALAKRFATIYPTEHPKGVTFLLKPLADADISGQFRRTLYVLLGAVGFLLLISCVNVANLLLARATGREREVAMRAALGAGRGRLVRQFLSESLLLAFSGAVLGCFLAWDLVDGLLAVIPSWYINTEAVIRINGPVLAFTLSVALLSTLLFGLAPALLATSGELEGALKESGRGVGASRRHHRLRNLLVVSEVALSLILLTGAGLLFRSFWTLRHAELGYNVSKVLRAGAALPEERYKTAAERNQFHMEMLRRVRALPGVVSAALGWPTMKWAGTAQMKIAGQSSSESQRVWIRLAGDGYFETLGIPLLRGRGISEEDLAQGRRVVVVNRAFTEKYFPGVDPLGHLTDVTVPSWLPPMKETRFEIVGVVEDTTHSEGTEPTVGPQLFIPYSAAGVPWNMLFIRTAGEPATLAKTIRAEFAAVDKELPSQAVPMADDLQDWYTEPRFVSWALIGFAALGMALVSIGIFSVLSYSVSQRTHEIGVRMALGAESADVLRFVLNGGLKWLLVGIGIGVPASIALAKILQNRVWGIKSADPLTLIAVSLVLTAVGLAACYFPARRATRLDPMVALRCE